MKKNILNFFQENRIGLYLVAFFYCSVFYGYLQPYGHVTLTIGNLSWVNQFLMPGVTLVWWIGIFLIVKKQSQLKPKLTKRILTIFLFYLFASALFLLYSSRNDLLTGSGGSIYLYFSMWIEGVFYILPFLSSFPIYLLALMTKFIFFLINKFIVIKLLKWYYNYRYQVMPV